MRDGAPSCRARRGHRRVARASGGLPVVRDESTRLHVRCRHVEAGSPSWPDRAREPRPADELLARVADPERTAVLLACDQEVCMPRACVAGHGRCGRRSGARPTSASPTSRSASCWRRRSRATTSRSTPGAWPRRDFEKAVASGRARRRDRAHRRRRAGARHEARQRYSRSARRSERAGQRRAGGSRGGRGARRCCSRGPSRRRTPRTQEAP